MRIYQMTADEAIKAFSIDTDSSEFNDDMSFISRAKTPFFVWCRGIINEIKSKFLLIDLLPIVCYLISTFFSLLDQNYKLLIFSILAILITFLAYVGSGALIFSYRQRFQRRLEESVGCITVIRNGKELQICSKDLAVGDLVLLEKGTILYGDARIVEGEDLYADEQMVFGAAIPSFKNAMLLEEENLAAEKQTNILWKGSSITQGNGRAIVFATGEECYVEKTGGRDRVQQRSWFYNKQKNIGHIGAYFYIILLALAVLLALLVTADFVEVLLLFGALSSVVMLNPFSIITEWSYYRTAESLYQNGALIRNIEAFDGMNKERALYYSSEELLKNSLSFHSIETVQSDAPHCLSHLALCLGNHPLSKTLDQPLKEYGIHRDALEREFPVYRSLEDDAGNVFSIFAGESQSVAVATGYWETMLPFIKAPNEEFLESIKKLEAEGKFVWLLASKGSFSIPNHLTPGDYEGAMIPMGIIVFEFSKKEELAEKISELRRSRMKVYLVNQYHKQLGERLAELYGINGCLSEYPAEPCYTLPQVKNNPNIVYNDASPIAKENAKVVLFGNIAPQAVIYRTKCMFCGIKRSIAFIICFGALLILTGLILTLQDVAVEKILFPVLLLRPALAAVCYYLVETVGNCNQYKRSLLLGALCGLVGLAASIFLFDTALLGMFLSAILLCVVCLLTVRKMRALRKKDFVLLLIALAAVIFPWIFMGGNIAAAILFALFPPISSYIINLFY